MAMKKHVEIQFASDPALLCIVRAAVGQMCHVAGFNKRTCSKIVLALDEACSNIIRHAYHQETNHTIRLVSGIDDEKIEFTLLDTGTPIDVAKIKSRQLDEIRPGGLGVYLIKSVMDFTEWSFAEKSGNKLYMYKIIPRGNN
ncbi:MAG: ATP-binding protein [candidate division KSB1 bacterium]|nr:ATP-binding protein [candidate division KSB1 bacterium]